MNLESHREEILALLRRKNHAPKCEEALWTAIKDAVARQAQTEPQPQGLIYALGLAYAAHTGAMPGFTNSDNETIFERFAGAVLVRVMPRVTQNQMRSAIRKMDAKRNPRFLADLALVSTHHAAE